MNRSEAGKLGILASAAGRLLARKAREEAYDSDPKLCLTCQKPIFFSKRRNNFCCRGCFDKGRSKDGSDSTSCPTCGGLFTKCGLGSHVWRVHGEGKNHKPIAAGTKAWNTGLTKETDARVAENARALSATLQKQVREGTFVSPSKTPEGRERLSRSAKERGFGGHTSKRALKYLRKDGTEVYLQSTYEERVAQELDQHGVLWTRPAPFSWTDGSGGTHRYYPDFFLPEHGVYLDPKNSYLIHKDALKIEAVGLQNNIKILVLDLGSLTWTAIQDLLHLGSQTLGSDTPVY